MLPVLSGYGGRVPTHQTQGTALRGTSPWLGLVRGPAGRWRGSSGTAPTTTDDIYTDSRWAGRGEAFIAPYRRRLATFFSHTSICEAFLAVCFLGVLNNFFCSYSTRTNLKTLSSKNVWWQVIPRVWEPDHLNRWTFLPFS